MNLKTLEGLETLYRKLLLEKGEPIKLLEVNALYEAIKEIKRK